MRMRCSRALVAVLLGVVAGGAARAQVPDWIDSPSGEGLPLWVSATRAVNGIGGSLRRELLAIERHDHFFGPDSVDEKLQFDSLEDLDRFLAEVTYPCEHLIVRSGGYRKPRSLREDFSNAQLVVRGTVRDQAAGFVRGAGFYTLVELEVEEWIKIPESQPRVATLYFPISAAKAVVDGHLWCYTTRRYPPTPQAGRQALIIALRDPYRDAVVHTDPLVVDRIENGLYFETEEGGTSVPHQGSDAPAEWRSLVDAYGRLRELDQ